MTLYVRRHAGGGDDGRRYGDARIESDNLDDRVACHCSRRRGAYRVAMVVKRKVRRDEHSLSHAPGETPNARYWITRGFSEALPPLALLLWVNGCISR